MPICGKSFEVFGPTPVKVSSPENNGNKEAGLPLITL
jgi:hypothetical protein